jgi:glycerol-3-phosphate dehydrogenase (NAD(P)+)
VNRLAIIGAGSWGSALAIVLGPRFERIRLWAHDPALAQRIRENHVNDLYLPEFPLPSHLQATARLDEALDGADIVLSAVPSHVVRSVYSQIAPVAREEMVFVSATKGLENGTLLRMSEVMREVLRPSFDPRVVVLSGPTFAREVAALRPTALVAASDLPNTAECIQRAFAGLSFRPYVSTDPTGVEIGGAIKNVIAIGAGVIHGLELGHNPTAALITRGLAEMTRLAVAMGGRQQTLAGLAGLGDLVLTCTGELSRNRTVGVELARGRKLGEIVGSMRMVAEGVKTTGAAVELAKRLSVEMPIAQQMFQMLHAGTPAREAVRALMERSLKGE